MTIVLFIAIAIGGYLLGSIPTGFLVARAKGIDIRQHGSGNIGATNVFRTLGKKLGIFVFVCDALKGVAGAVLGCVVFRYFGSPALQSMPAIGGILGSVACILGHNFPVWLKFKGGKGVATSLGVVFGLVPLAGVIAFAVWGVVFFVSRYVSLASIIGCITVPVTVAFTAHGNDRVALLIFTGCAAALIILRHRANIQRLLNGTENRFTKKPK